MQKYEKNLHNRTIMNPNKKAEKLTHRHLDKIYRTCRSVTTSYRDQVISMGVLKFVVDKSKLSSPDLPSEFVTKFNETHGS